VRLREDVVYASRLFRRQPAIVGMTIAGLALAIGISTAAFTIIDLTVAPRHGVPDPHSVATLRSVAGTAGDDGLPIQHADYLALREGASAADITACFLYSTGSTVRLAAEEAERTFRSGQFAAVSGNYFAVIGGKAAIGRTLSDSDDTPGAPNTVVLRHAFWTTQFGGDASVLGRTIWFNDEPSTVVGIAEPAFRGACDGEMGWTSLPAFLERNRISQARLLKPGEPARPLFDLVRVFVRPHGDETLQSVEPAINALATRIFTKDGSVDARGRTPIRLRPIDELSQRERTRLLASGVLIALLLLIACANVTNLLLASATGRIREIGTRLALGARRGQIVRMLLTESLLLGVVGAAAGLVIALWATPTLAHLMGEQAAPDDLAPNLRVFGFMVLVAIGASALAGLAPARRSARLDLTSAVKSDLSGRPRGLSGSRLRSTLIAVQSAIAVVLLILAGLATRVVVKASGAELGADVPRLVNVTIQFKDVDDDSRRFFVDAAKTRLRELTGVDNATRVVFPLFGHGGAHGRLVSGGSVNFNYADADYFATAGIRLVGGRTFSVDEVRTTARVAVISESLAKTYWSDRNPIGDSMERLWGADDREGASLTSWNRKPAGTRIIGVAAETWADLTDRSRPVIYLPLHPGTETRESLVVRAGIATDPDSLNAPIRDALKSLDSRVSITVESADANRRAQLAYPVSRAMLGGLLGFTALALALVGLFGVTAFSVAQRRHEIAVRLAIGASRGGILRMLIGASMRPVIAGVGGGLLLSKPVLDVLQAVIGHQGRIFDVTPYDGYALGGAVIAMCIAAIAAAAAPARHAMNVDAAEVLKQA
jgi:predicted permease